jgi:putative transposase
MTGWPMADGSSLTMTDLCSKEVPVIEVDVSIGGERVCRILDRLFAGRSLPRL